MLPNLRTLIIDDSELILDENESLLSQLGITKVSRALNVNEAHKLLNDGFDKEDPFHLIICDHHMPGTSGIDFLKNLRINLRFKDTPYITCTSDSNRTTVLPYITMGADSFIVKPVNRADLENKIQQVWKKRGRIK